MQQQLHQWYNENKRDLPWRNTTNPYIIWLSEIILQQTRVEQGLPYFNNFLNAYKSITEFANADLNEVLKLWQGLGYYSRARNMHATAVLIRDYYNGVFPQTYAELIKLKGIGPYTAAAIASFASNEAKAVVDGNVYRVLSRFAGVYTDINSTEGKKEFALLANELLDTQNPATHNQAIMELGALVCKPQNPNCLECPLNNACYAFEHKVQQQLPVKIKTVKIKQRYFNYAIINYKDSTFIKQRAEKDIWHGLFEFPMVEKTKLLNETDLIHAFAENNIHIDTKTAQIEWIGNDKHQLTHQTLFANFYKITCNKAPQLPDIFLKIKLAQLQNYAIPRLLDKFISNDKLQQSLF